MFMKKTLLLLSVALLGASGLLWWKKKLSKDSFPLVAIASYGPHSSLSKAIDGIKEKVAESLGSVEFEVQDVNFDTSLIPQMIKQLISRKPKVLVVLTTPVAQYAKSAVKDVPIVYCAITDPVEAGLIRQEGVSLDNVTGVSERQNYHQILAFAKKILPKSKKMGLLFCTSETNDQALVKEMEKAGQVEEIEVLAIPVGQARDVPVAAEKFRGRVDFIYVGTSGPIQPTLPAIAAIAEKIKIPVINADENAVLDGLALASYGVNYQLMGKMAGTMVADLLMGKKTIIQIPPVDPTGACCSVNQRLSKAYQVIISDQLVQDLKDSGVEIEIKG